MTDANPQMRSMWIAPSRHPEIRNWTDAHWKELTFRLEHDWDTAIEIFEDRIKYRYLDAIEVLQKDDNEHYSKYRQRRFGFAMIALGCLLIETLAQFYAGLQESPKRKNHEFYITFLTRDSFVLKNSFKSKAAAGAFYNSIRCGILHQAETKLESTIRFYDDMDYSSEPFILLDDGESMRIHWSLFHPIIKSEFDVYCAHLKANDVPELRTSLKEKWISFVE